jgi:hypothetical protein
MIGVADQTGGGVTVTGIKTGRAVLVIASHRVRVMGGSSVGVMGGCVDEAHATTSRVMHAQTR